MNDRLLKCSCGSQFLESEGGESFNSSKIICGDCLDAEAEILSKEIEIKNLKDTVVKAKARLTELGVEI